MPTRAAPSSVASASFTSRNWRSRLRDYFDLAKSGIVTLVLVSVFAGYLTGQALDRPLNGLRLVLTLAGMLALAAGSSALNQLSEVHIDARMPRTANRPLPSGRISFRAGLIFSFAAIVCGIFVLTLLDPQLGALGIVALISYNGLYTLWWKPQWAFAAIPGAVPGALPIWMGYVAASGSLTAPAGLYLFFILFYWQMPHFWALALRYRDDYARGNIPTLPVVLGEPKTRHQIVLWTLSFIALALLAPFFLQARGIYALSSALISAKLLYELLRFLRLPTSTSWLRFFLWVNFALILYLAAAVLDHWSPLWLGYLAREYGLPTWWL